MPLRPRQLRRANTARHLHVETLEVRQLLAADVRITEFLASNQNGIEDGNGQTSDWIELFNAESEPVNLAGWHLSDEPSNPLKWTFPDIEIQPNSYLIVFASGQNVDDYIDPTGHVHTNFNLSAAGEYLGLISPDLETVSEFGPNGTSYPLQEPDISYGVGAFSSSALVERGSPAQMYVPSNDQLGATWTGLPANEPFDDSPAAGWQSTALGIGYDISAIEATSTETVGNTLITRSTTDLAEGSLFALESSPFSQIGTLTHWSIYTQATRDITPMIVRLVDVDGYVITGIGQTRTTTGAGPEQFEFEILAGSDQVGPEYFFAWKDGTNGANNAGVAPFDATGDASVRWFGQHTTIATGEVLGPGQSLTRTYSIQATAEFPDAPVPIGYWSFDNGATDDSGNGADGDIRGATASDEVPAAIGRGRSLDFNGQNAYVSVALDVSEVSYTASMWFQADAAGHGLFAVVDGDLGSGGHDRHLYLNGGNIASRVWNTETITSSGQNFADGQWHHLAHVYGSGIGGQRIYIDGQLVASGTKSQSDFNWQKHINIGFSNDAVSDYFDGRIDDVAVWSRELSELQIQALASGASPLALGGLAGEVTTDVEASVRNVNSSVYLRVPFDVADPSEYDSLLLRMKYDDGFVAYVNGVEVTRRNAPAVLSFDATAASDNPTSLAVRTEEISIVGAASLLHTGTNILAFQALNDAVDSDEFLLAPELFLIRSEDGLYMTEPTPGGPNRPGVAGFVEAPTFSVSRGFYTAPFDVALASTTPGATIVYTTDGSVPTATNGTRIEPANATTTPTGSVHIDSFTNLRAAAIKDGYATRGVETHTYVFVAEVAAQPILPDGYPATWSGGVAADYEVDPDVVNGTLPGYGLEESLLSLPTLSITTDFENFWGNPSGIYYNTGQRGIGSEVVGSLELIYPDGREGFQVEAGFRSHGNSSRSHGFTPKHPLRVYFRSEYGDSKLVFPLFGEEAAIEFDHILLRGASTDSFPVADGGSRWVNERGTYLRDQWMRDTQIAMGHVSSHGTYVHLYINGLYWGLYNPSERPTDAFQASYFGGEKEEYDVLKDFAEIESGTKDTWNAMVAMAAAGLQTDEAYQRIQGNNPDGSRNPDYPVYLNVESLIDYMILHIYAGSEDWPHHNWWAARRRGTESTGFHFYSWDQEISNESLTRTNAGGGNRFQDPLMNREGPSQLYGYAMQNASFRDQFANRVHELLFNDGLLTPENASARWQARQQEIDLAMVAESARWGDRQQADPHTREDEWLSEMDWMRDTYWDANYQRVLARFRDVVLNPPGTQYKLYPDVEAPVYNQHGGAVDAGFQLSMSADNGDIFYTLDGRDPLQADGSLHPDALPYTGPISVDASVRVRARARVGEDWSAANDASFIVAGIALAPQVVINEVHYDPDIKTEPVEFIELLNAGSVAADLSHWSFTNSIQYEFPVGAMLAPGEYLVVSQDPQALQDKFGVGAYGPFTGSLQADGETIALTDAEGAAIDQVDYQLGFPWPTVGDAPGPSIQLVDPALENDLGGSWRSALPTPGAENSIAAENAAPQMRQVAHAPHQPVAGQEVVVTVKVTDPEGVASVALEYQLVEPGDYIAIDDPRYATQWTQLAMHDDGLAGDALAQDNIYSITLPGALQTHRRLVRYRIVAADTLGASITGPYADDPQPNFAYYTYDGVPDWTGARTPGVTELQAFGPEVMDQLPVLQLLARADDVTKSQYDGAFDKVRFSGTLIFNGQVYDHIAFSNRGEFSTYVSGKNKWQLNFNRGHDFEPVDNYGNPRAAKVRKLNLNAAASPWVPANRGMGGLEEAVGYQLYDLAGVPSPQTSFLQFRVVDGAAESNPNDQFDGDLWGLYMTLEEPDGRFLDERALADGNTYKIEGGQGDKKNQGPTQSEDATDWNTFNSDSTQSQTVAWWRENLDLDAYFSFRAINRAVANIDLREGWNHFFYHSPDGLWAPIPWDLDMLVMPETHWSGTINQKSLLAHEELLIEYQTRARELLDLLFSDRSDFGGQAVQLVDELAAVLNPPGQSLTFVDLDEAMWNEHPRTSASHRGQFYANPKSQNFRGGTVTRTLVSADHEGFEQYLKDFFTDVDPDDFAVGDGDQRGYGFNYLELEAADSDIPATPQVQFVGQPGFARNQLQFETSPFSDPNGDQTFAGMQWRIGEITNPAVPGYQPGTPYLYEIDAVWESGTLDEFNASMTIPADAVEPGRTYRVRVRMQDDSGRFSHWSAPIEFVAGEATGDVIDGLRIAEIHYHPPDPTDGELAANPALDADDFEFVELINVGAQPIDLSGVRFVDGIDFQFASSQPQILAAGARAVLVKDLAAFQLRYGDAGPIVGQFFSGSLNNGGETLALADSDGIEFLSIDYAPSGDWPMRADGVGSSLEMIDAAGDPTSATAWRASSEYGGSPGAAGAGPRSDVVINEVLTHTDPPQSDSVELLNTTNAAIDIGGWYVSDSTTLRKFRIPLATILGPGQYLVFDEDDFNPGLGGNATDFSFNGAHGDDAWLVEADENDNLVSFVDMVSFGAAANGESFGRWPNGTGQLWPMSEVTLGGFNSGPRIGPLVISEIMYNPPDPDASGPVDPDDLEFLEIYNPTEAAVPLANWQVLGGVQFDFAAATSIAPRTAIVVAPFDPALEPALRAQFVDFYAIDPATVILGPYSGKLANGGETIELSRPDDRPADEPGFIPRLLEDRVTYFDAPPWPVEADGAGASLTRLGSREWSAEARRWTDAPPTPGTFVDHSISVQIIDVTAHDSGFDAALLRDIDLAKLNLYDGIDPQIDLADVRLVGNQVGPVAGSLIWEAATQTIRFVRTGGPLAPDTYTVTISSRADGLLDTAGEMLDGDFDGQPGGDFVSQFVVVDQAARYVSLPDFAVGPRQIAQFDGQFGIPISINDGQDVVSVGFTLRYDPGRLQLIGPSLADDLPAGWKISGVQNIASGVLRLNVSGPTPLAAGPASLIRLLARVPDLAARGEAHEIVVEAVEVNGGDLAARGESAIHALAFPGDPSNSADFSGFDASLVARVTIGIDTGFDAFPRVDPILIADVTGNGRLSALDASFIARKAVGGEQPEIPDIPPQANLAAPAPIDEATLTTSSAAASPLAAAQALEQVSYTIDPAQSQLVFSGSATLNGIPVPFVEVAPGSLVDSVSGTIVAELAGNTLTFSGGSLIDPDPNPAGPFLPSVADTGSGSTEDNYGGQGLFLNNTIMLIAGRDLLGDLLGGSADFGGPVTGISFDVTAGTIGFQELIDGTFGFFDAGLEIAPSANMADGVLGVMNDGSSETITLPVQVTSPFQTTTDLGVVNGEVTLTGQLVASRIIVPPAPRVVATTWGPSGVAIEFSEPLAAELLNLYDGIDASEDPADLLLTGDATGPVTGSLHWDATTNTLHFTKSGGPLVADNYTLTLLSRTDGFVTADGTLLDGDDDGSPGGDFQELLLLTPSNLRSLGMPDVVRAAGQTIDLQQTGGIPVSVDDGDAVTNVEFLFEFDPDPLAIGSVDLAADLPADWRIVRDDRSSDAAIALTLAGSTPLASGARSLLVFDASVPQLAPAGSTAILSIANVQLNQGDIAATGDDAFQAITLLADPTGSGDYSALDASLIARVAVGLDTGFDAFDKIDPVLIGDASANGDLSALDASFTARQAVGLPQAEIPAPPKLAFLYVAADAPAGGNGTAAAPLRSIQAALDLAAPGTAIVIGDGVYGESLATRTAGTAERRITLAAEHRGAVTVESTSTNLLLQHPYYTIDGIRFDGLFGNRDIIQATTTADYGTLQYIEVAHGRADGIDLGDNPTNALPSDYLDGFSIHDAHIHELLNFDGANALDAHGIVAGAVRDFTIRRAEVHYVSGDALQLQDGGWDYVLVDAVRFWNGPLPAAAGGFPAGVNPGENAIDTKQDEHLGVRGRLWVQNSEFFGWDSDYIGNSAALNLKEAVDASVQRNQFSNNEIALRLRGRDLPGFTGVGAHVDVANNVLFDNLVAVRYEDAINQLHIDNNTFGQNNATVFVAAPSATGAGDDFQVRNNLIWADALPAAASGGANLLASEADFADPATNDYRLRSDSAAIDAGDLLAHIQVDRAGVLRPQGAALDMGAFETPETPNAALRTIDAALEQWANTLAEELAETLGRQSP
ncbi:MAG: lamin tail domain-containing protein [Planctomycetales bacterium]|nr:lamin tail domain-containing protein [Planctomycetales bacterium]